MMRNYAIFGFMSVILCFQVFGYTVYSENFDYAGTFASQGWTFSNGGCGSASSSPVTLYDTGKFGNNNTNASSYCNFGFTQSIKRNFTANSFYSGGITTDFTYSVWDNDDPSQFSQIGMANNSFSGTILTGLKIYDTYAKTFDDKNANAVCNISFSDLGYAMPYNLTFRMFTDLTNAKFSVYMIINGSSVPVCSDITMNYDSMNIKGVALFSSFTTRQTYVLGFDDLVISLDVTNLTEDFPVGQPCTTDSECITDNCVFGVCRYKTTLQSCDFNYECLSGQCIGNKCTQPSLFQAVDDTKNQLFGTDKQSSTMIVMIFMAISCAAILIISGMANALKAGFYLSILALYLEAFFFAMIGWLSFFMVFAFVLVAVIFIIATIFIMNRMPN